MLKFIAEELKRHREIVLGAVARDGSALEFDPAKLKRDREFVLEAAKRNFPALSSFGRC